MDCPKDKMSGKTKAADVLRKTRSRPSKKMAKDPNAPKRAMTTFLLFSNDKRAEIRAANPDMKVTDISRELGRLWKDVDEAVKAKYQKMADEDKRRYEKEFKEYHKK